MSVDIFRQVADYLTFFDCKEVQTEKNRTIFSQNIEMRNLICFTAFSQLQQVSKVSEEKTLCLALEALEDTFRNEKEYWIHGNFHPGNVILDKSGCIKVIDYEYASLGPREFDLASFVADTILFSVSNENDSLSRFDTSPTTKCL